MPRAAVIASISVRPMRPAAPAMAIRIMEELLSANGQNIGFFHDQLSARREVVR
jgi:hypothetical protein